MEAVDPAFEYQFRIILIGNSMVGKSSLLKYLTEGRCPDIVEATVGVDFFAKVIEVSPGIRVKLQMWDTAGQERFRWVYGLYCAVNLQFMFCSFIVKGKLNLLDSNS